MQPNYGNSKKEIPSTLQHDIMKKLPPKRKECDVARFYYACKYRNCNSAATDDTLGCCPMHFSYLVEQKRINFPGRTEIENFCKDKRDTSEHAVRNVSPVLNETASHMFTNKREVNHQRGVSNNCDNTQENTVFVLHLNKSKTCKGPETTPRVIDLEESAAPSEWDTSSRHSRNGGKQKRCIGPLCFNTGLETLKGLCNDCYSTLSTKQLCSGYESGEDYTSTEISWCDSQTAKSLSQSTVVSLTSRDQSSIVDLRLQEELEALHIQGDPTGQVTTKQSGGLNDVSQNRNDSTNTRPHNSNSGNLAINNDAVEENRSVHLGLTLPDKTPDQPKKCQHMESYSSGYHGPLRSPYPVDHTHYNNQEPLVESIGLAGHRQNTGYDIKPREDVQHQHHAQFACGNQLSDNDESEFEKLIKGIERNCTRFSVKCRATNCSNFGNNKCKGYCNSCYSKLNHR